MHSYQFHPSLMLRTPAFSYLHYNLSKMGRLIKKDFFKAALYLANPAFYQKVAAKSFSWDMLSVKE